MPYFKVVGDPVTSKQRNASYLKPPLLMFLASVCQDNNLCKTYSDPELCLQLLYPGADVLLPHSL